MIEVKTTARKWGNSIGISLPKEVIEQANIEPNQEIRLYIPEKRRSLRKIFGTLNIREPTQRILDKTREGEE